MGLPAGRDNPPGCWDNTRKACKSRNIIQRNTCLHVESQTKDKRKNQMQTQTKCDDSLNMAVAYRLRYNEYRIIKPIITLTTGCLGKLFTTTLKSRLNC